jgi:hypothetical protein
VREELAGRPEHDCVGFEVDGAPQVKAEDPEVAPSGVVGEVGLAGTTGAKAREVRLLNGRQIPGDDDDRRVRVPGEERAERGHEAWEKAAVGVVDEGVVPPGHGTTGAGGGGRGAPGTVGGDGGVRLERVDRRHDVGFGDEVAGAAGQLLARLLTGMRSRGKAVGAVPIPGATPTRLDYSYRQPLSWFT